MIVENLEGEMCKDARREKTFLLTNSVGLLCKVLRRGLGEHRSHPSNSESLLTWKILPDRPLVTLHLLLLFKRQDDGWQKSDYAHLPFDEESARLSVD